MILYIDYVLAALIINICVSLHPYKAKQQKQNS